MFSLALYTKLTHTGQAGGHYYCEETAVKKVQGLPLTILFLFGGLLSFSLSLHAKNSEVDSVERNAHARPKIEEGWVEKKIAPPTQWIESLFASFTGWMESEIQRTPDTTNNATNIAPNSDVISIRQAIAIVLKQHPGKVLRSQFYIGPPPHYQIKVLSDQGNVSIFYINAFSGQPFLPESALDSKPSPATHLEQPEATP